MRFINKNNGSPLWVLPAMALVLGAFFSSAVSAHSGAKGIVKERMDRMQVMQKSMKALAEKVKSSAPLVPNEVVTYAQQIQQATQGLTERFPKGSTQAPSEALPVIWDSWDRFVLLTDDLLLQAQQLEQVAHASASRDIRKQYARLAETCRTCHADFRKRKSKQKGRPIVVTDISMTEHAMPAMPAMPDMKDMSTHTMPEMPEPTPAPDAAEAMTMAALPSKPMASAQQANTVLSEIDRGEYLFRVGGCASCHTVDPQAPLAGGLEMETPFGIFYTPNISPDKGTGIGDWSEDAFIRAMRNGVSPSGEHYYPAFPYTSYAKMPDQDLKDLKAYLDRQPAINRENRPHQLSFPFDQRWLLTLWKGLFFEAKAFEKVAARSETWNRGAYIVNGPGHCVECHSPRNMLGALDHDALLTGNPKGPEDEEIPAIHGEKSFLFSRWSKQDIQFALETGITPEGDAMGSSMAHVIKNSTSHMTADDLAAIAEYLARPQ